MLDSVAHSGRILHFLTFDKVLNPLAEEPPFHSMLAEIEGTLLFLAFLIGISYIYLQLSLY
jgi:hypothetical protein